MLKFFILMYSIVVFNKIVYCIRGKNETCNFRWNLKFIFMVSEIYGVEIYYVFYIYFSFIVVYSREFRREVV